VDKSRRGFFKRIGLGVGAAVVAGLPAKVAAEQAPRVLKIINCVEGANVGVFEHTEGRQLFLGSTVSDGVVDGIVEVPMDELAVQTVVVRVRKWGYVPFSHTCELRESGLTIVSAYMRLDELLT